MGEKQENLVTPSQLAVALSVEYQTIAKLRAEGMPCYPAGVGKVKPHYRFDVDEVKVWLKNRKEVVG